MVRLNDAPYTVTNWSFVMRPHVKKLRKKFQALTRNGVLKPECTCCKCAKTAEDVGRKLELHHIVPLNSLEEFDTFDPNVPSNLMTLCHECHQAYHSCFEEEYPCAGVLDFVRDVSIEDAYEALRLFRLEKRRKSEMERLKHATTNARRKSVHPKDGQPDTG